MLVVIPIEAQRAKGTIAFQPGADELALGLAEDHGVAQSALALPS
jgi:hypothetical protein